MYKYNFRSSLYGNLYFYQIIIIYFISLVLYLLAIIKNIKIKIINISSLFLISLISAQIIEIIAYYPSGSISFFYVPYIFPAFSISMLTLKNKKSISKDNFWNFLKIVLIIMIIVSCIIFWCMINTYDAGNTKLTKFENSKSSFHYLINYYDNSTVITDFSLLHKYLIRESDNKNYIINYLLLTTDDYNNILNIYNFGEKNNATIILDYMSMKYNIPIDIRGSRGFQLIPYINNINNYQNCIYLDGSVIIYK